MWQFNDNYDESLLTVWVFKKTQKLCNVKLDIVGVRGLHFIVVDFFCVS